MNLKSLRLMGKTFYLGLDVVPDVGNKIKFFLLSCCFIDLEMIEKVSLANSHLPQLIGLVLMAIGYTLGNKFYLPEIKQK